MCNGNNNEPSMFNLTIMCGKFQFKSQSVGPSHEPDAQCISVMLRNRLADRVQISADPEQMTASPPLSSVMHVWVKVWGLAT